MWKQKKKSNEPFTLRVFQIYCNPNQKYVRVSDCRNCERYCGEKLDNVNGGILCENVKL